jgi:hypothetical protein
MNKRQIYRADSVELTEIKSSPPQINITAYGTATSADWSRTELVPFIYVQNPPDGIFDFEFVAEPPPGQSAQVLTSLWESRLPMGKSAK